jgi:hypothetical protein
VTPEAFRALVQFLYTGGMEVPFDYVDDCLRLANHLKLEDMKIGIEDAVANVKEFSQ